MFSKIKSSLIIIAVTITVLIACGIRLYNAGAEYEKNICENEKKEILLQHANTTEHIIQENNKKTDAQRRKDLAQYVIKQN